MGLAYAPKAAGAWALQRAGAKFVGEVIQSALQGEETLRRILSIRRHDSYIQRGDWGHYQ